MHFGFHRWYIKFNRRRHSHARSRHLIQINASYSVSNSASWSNAQLVYLFDIVNRFEGRVRDPFHHVAVFVELFVSQFAIKIRWRRKILWHTDYMEELDRIIDFSLYYY